MSPGQQQGMGQKTRSNSRRKCAAYVQAGHAVLLRVPSIGAGNQAHIRLAVFERREQLGIAGAAEHGGVASNADLQPAAVIPANPVAPTLKQRGQGKSLSNTRRRRQRRCLQDGAHTAKRVTEGWVEGRTSRSQKQTRSR